MEGVRCCRGPDTRRSRRVQTRGPPGGPAHRAASGDAVGPVGAHGADAVRGVHEQRHAGSREAADAPVLPKVDDARGAGARARQAVVGGHVGARGVGAADDHVDDLASNDKRAARARHLRRARARHANASALRGARLDGANAAAIHAVRPNWAWQTSLTRQRPAPTGAPVSHLQHVGVRGPLASLHRPDVGEDLRHDCHAEVQAGVGREGLLGRELDRAIGAAQHEARVYAQERNGARLGCRHPRGCVPRPSEVQCLQRLPAGPPRAGSPAIVRGCDIGARVVEAHPQAVGDEGDARQPRVGRAPHRVQARLGLRGRGGKRTKSNVLKAAGPAGSRRGLCTGRSRPRRRARALVRRPRRPHLLPLPGLPDTSGRPPLLALTFA